MEINLMQRKQGYSQLLKGPAKVSQNRVRISYGKFWRVMENEIPFSRTGKFWKRDDFQNGNGRVLDFCLEKS